MLKNDSYVRIRNVFLDIQFEFNNSEKLSVEMELQM